MEIRHFAAWAVLLMLAACSGNSTSSNQNSEIAAPADSATAGNTDNAGDTDVAEAAPAAPGTSGLAPGSPPIAVAPFPPAGNAGTPTFAVNPSLLNVSLLKRVLVHAAQCQWRGTSSGKISDGKYYAESTYLCSVELPPGAKVTKVTLYPHNFSSDEDPLEVGVIGLPAAGGNYLWRSDFSAKAATLKEDNGGYTTALLANCSAKDWTFASSLQPLELSCDYTQNGNNRLYFKLSGYLNTPDKEVAEMNPIPAVANLIAVQYSGI